MSPSALLSAQASRFGGHPLFILPQAVAELWQTRRTIWTYAEAEAEVARLSAAYAGAGYGAGHRVALLLQNRPAHFLHWLALNRLGASVVPANPDSRGDELAHLLSHSGAALLVALPERQPSVSETAAGLGVTLVAPGEEPPPAPPPVGTEPDECTLIYTSGTTAKPKGCVLPNAYFQRWGQWYAAQPAPIALQEGQERLMTPLPCFHVNAMAHSFMGMLATGGAQVIVDRFHPRSWWQMAAETGATCFHYLGVMPAILMELPPGPQDRAHGFRFGLGGGVHPDHHAAFEARFGAPLLEGWAMTETGGACLMCAVGEPRHVGRRCIGRPDRPGPVMEARVVGEDGAAAEEGELLVRGEGMFAGYLKDPAATAAAFDGEWFRTGDIVRRDAAGALYFVDRKKNIIRRSGENIAAAEVEAALVRHPRVRAVAVVATADPLRGEEVLAAAVPEGPEDGLAEELLDFAAGRLAYFKLPGWICFLDALPVTSTQKVRKADLGALAQNPAGAARGHDLRAAKQALRGRPHGDGGSSP